MNEHEAYIAAERAALYVKESALAVSKAIAWHAYSVKSATKTAAEYEDVAKAILEAAIADAKGNDDPNFSDYCKRRVKGAAKFVAMAAEYVATARAATKSAAVYAEAAAKATDQSVK